MTSALLPFPIFAAGLTWNATTTVIVPDVTFTTLTIAAGSEATSFVVETATVTVTVPAASVFTLNASSDITFSNTASIATTCGETSSLVVSDPVTDLVITPTNSACPRASTGRTTASALPPSPTGMKAVGTPAGIVLTWSDPSASRFSSIVILRNAGGATTIPLSTYAGVAKGVQRFTDTATTPGVAYEYLVRAVNAAGMDENNTTVRATMPIAEQKVVTPEDVLKETEAPKTETTTQEKVSVEIIPAPASDRSTEATTQIFTADTVALATAVGRTVDLVVEGNIRATEKIASVFSGATETQEKAAVAFVAYGTPATVALGEGERAGALDSYKRAYGALPTAEAEWGDALRIAAGQAPTQKSMMAEERAVMLFMDLYGRAPSIRFAEGSTSVLLAEGADREALVILAYGVRPEVRSLARERDGIRVFQKHFSRDPKNAEDWDTVRALAYTTIQ